VVRRPIYATGVGLALWGARGRAQATAPFDGGDFTILARISRRMSEWFGEIF